MKNKVIIDADEVLKAFKKALMEKHKQKSINVTYLDKDGNIKKIKTKTK